MSIKCTSWVYDQQVGGALMKAVLAKIADNANDDGIAWPSVRLLCQQTEIPERTIKKKIKELCDGGWLSIRARRAETGQYSGNVYQVCVPWAPGAPGGQPTGGTGRQQPGANAPATRERVPLPEPSEEPSQKLALRGPGHKVGGSLVTAQEASLAAEVLSAWNAATGQTLAARSWLDLVVRRHREHPELGLIDYEHVIHATLAHPWWNGPPSPNLIFGNDMQFEKSITVAQSNGNGHSNGHRPKATSLRFGRGLTTAQIMEMDV